MIALEKTLSKLRQDFQEADKKLDKIYALSQLYFKNSYTNV